MGRGHSVQESDEILSFHGHLLSRPCMCILMGECRNAYRSVGSPVTRSCILGSHDPGSIHPVEIDWDLNPFSSVVVCRSEAIHSLTCKVISFM